MIHTLLKLKVHVCRGGGGGGGDLAREDLVFEGNSLGHR